jgi:hypothetical protein
MNGFARRVRVVPLGRATARPAGALPMARVTPRRSWPPKGAVDAQEYEQTASLRDRGRTLHASKAAVQEEWAAGHPGLPSLAERCQQLSGEIDRRRALLRRHGIEPEDKPA